MAQRLQLTPLPLTLPSLISSLLLPYTISQSDYPAIIWQLQKQIATLIAQVGSREREGNTATATEVAKLQTFDRTALKVSRFVGVCRMYIKMRLRKVSVEEQVNWVLLYVQGESADIWKKNIIKKLEIGEFLAEIKKEFGGGDKELVKVAELKKIEQGTETIEEFVQEFKKIARGSRYEERSLIKEFKWGMNGNIRRKLMEAENQLATIEH